MIIAIPYEIPSHNKTKGRHWSANHRETKRCAALIRSYGWEACNAKGHRKVHLIAYRVQTCRDMPNLIGGTKSLSDGMVQAGALVDDCDKLASFTYEQHPLSKLPDDLLAKFGRRPVTVIQISDTQEAT